MAADINLQAWLETDSATHPPIVTPYVQSAQSQRIHYKILVVRKGRGGTSQIGQGGSVTAQAGLATALSQFSISVGRDDECRIELMLITDDVTDSSYRFECPR